MKCMNLIMNMQQSYADDLEQLLQQLEGLGIDPYVGVGTLIVGPSDTYYNELSREWSPWPDPYQQDDIARGWSPWPDTRQQDN